MLLGGSLLQTPLGQPAAASDPRGHAASLAPLAGLGSAEVAASLPAAEWSGGIARLPPHTGRVSWGCPKQRWVSAGGGTLTLGSFRWDGAGLLESNGQNQVQVLGALFAVLCTPSFLFLEWKGVKPSRAQR